MHQIMKEIRKVPCDASLIPDNDPGMGGDTSHRIAMRIWLASCAKCCGELVTKWGDRRFVMII